VHCSTSSINAAQWPRGTCVHCSWRSCHCSRLLSLCLTRKGETKRINRRKERKKDGGGRIERARKTERQTERMRERQKDRNTEIKYEKSEGENEKEHESPKDRKNRERRDKERV
jgi:hypothetical protein